MMMMELPPHGDARARDYEPLLPREAFSPPEPDKANSHHPLGEQLEKMDSVDGEDAVVTCLFIFNVIF